MNATGQPQSDRTADGVASSIDYDLGESPTGSFAITAAQNAPHAHRTTEEYFNTRFKPDPRRDAVWKHIAAYLSTWWSPDAAVLDVGAGYCSFINAISARRRVAIDLNPAVGEFAAPGVETIVGSATDIAQLVPSGQFDLAFSSNLLEHLDHEQIATVLDGCGRALRPGGRLILVGPNFRLCARRYWDDYTHVTALSDVSLSDFVRSRGFRVIRVEPRFMPFSLKTRFARLSGLTPLYLRSPIRPLAGQMLVVAEKVADV